MKAARTLLLLAAFGTLALLLAYLSPAELGAESGQIGARRQSRTRPKVGPHELDFAYYSLLDGSNSTLSVINRSPDALPVVVALRSRSGKALLAPSQTIPPHEKASVDLGALVLQLGGDVLGDFAEGSVTTYFTGRVTSLAGHINISDVAHRNSWVVGRVIDAAIRRPESGGLHGLWWGIGSGRDAVMVVSNTTATALTADWFLDFLGKRHSGAPLKFEAYETKRLSVLQLLADCNASPSQAPEGGISIIPQGAHASLIAEGRVEDPRGGFSSGLRFHDPAHELASALHANGIPIGTPSSDSPYALMGTYVPHVIVRNLQSGSQTVSIMVEYAGAKGTEQIAMPSLTLAGYTSQETTLESIVSELPLPLPFCSIRIQHDGPPGSVLAAVSSVEVGGSSAIDSPVANEGDGWAGSGTYAWHLDQHTESVIFLTNETDKQAPFVFTVFAHGMAYHVDEPYLNPHETRVIDLRKLRDAQKPDLLGHQIPADATDGIVKWTRVGKMPVMGQIEVLQTAAGIATPDFQGGDPCPPCFAGSLMIPTEASLSPNQSQGFQVRVEYGDCNGDPPSYNPVVSDWTSYNTAVATVSPARGTSTLARAVGPGSADIMGDFMVHDCDPCGPCDCSDYDEQEFGTVNVQNPTITVTRQSLTSTSASGSSSATGATFSYRATGSGNIASYSTQNASANPNTASITAPSNPGGSPTPGGLGTLVATYNVYGQNPSKSFPAGTFGLSCYYTALETDWGDPTKGTCGRTTYNGTVYSGTTTNPGGLPARQYCTAFLKTVAVNGSGVLKDGTTKIQYVSGGDFNWTFTVVTAIYGADHTPVVAGQTLARDRAIIGGTSSIHVQLPSGTRLANDTGSPNYISGYRLDLYQGAGKAVCASYSNPIVVGACDVVSSTCPGYQIQ